jgi:hypothetical protein
LSEFGKDKHRGDGLTTRCRSCRNAQNRHYFANHPEMRKKHNDLNKEKRKEYYSTPENKLKLRNNHLKKGFNLTHEDYEEMLKKQNGVCLICKRHRVASNKGHMTIDHCHATGKIRGILCSWCNRGLGVFEDNVQFLKNAIKYLKETSK